MYIPDEIMKSYILSAMPAAHIPSAVLRFYFFNAFCISEFINVKCTFYSRIIFFLEASPFKKNVELGGI